VDSSVGGKKVWVLVICAGPRLGLVELLRTEHMKIENLTCGICRSFPTISTLTIPHGTGLRVHHFPLSQSSAVRDELERSRSTIYNLIVKASDAACSVQDGAFRAKPDVLPSHALHLQVAKSYL
jgi:hypothetical protein